MFVFTGLFYLYFNSFQCEQNCGTLVKSTCSDDSITSWNRKNVGEHLKDWVQSIQTISPVSGPGENHIFIEKTLIWFEGKKDSVMGENTFIQLIANNLCSERKHFGPLWKKASTFSGTQFHDGFLYGVDNKEEKITGYVFYIYIKKNGQNSDLELNFKIPN